MSESKFSAPCSTILDQTVEAEKKLNEQKKEEADRARLFTEALSQLLQQEISKQQASLHNLLLLKEEQLSLEKLAKDHGYSDLKSALNSAINPQGRTPLAQALHDQNFAMANALLTYGAEYDPVARAEYGIAIDSKRGKEAQITSPRDYQPSPEKLPAVKEFGLVLGINMVGQDGTTSQRANIQPTYQLMTNAVNDYAKKDTLPEQQKNDFNQISDAFTFANETAKFDGNDPTGLQNGGGQAIRDRIKKGEGVTTVPTSCEGHVMGLSFVPVKGEEGKSSYLIFTNRGEGAEQPGTQIYKVDNNQISKEFIDTMISGHYEGKSHKDIMGEINKVTGGNKSVCSIDQKPQKNDNCTIANTRANIHGILLCQEANRQGGFDHVNNKEEVKQSVEQSYKEFTDDMRTKKVQELQQTIEKNPDNQDLKNLAKGYLAEHRDSKFSQYLKIESIETSQISAVSK